MQQLAAKFLRATHVYQGLVVGDMVQHLIAKGADFVVRAL